MRYASLTFAQRQVVTITASYYAAIGAQPPPLIQILACQYDILQ